MVYLGVASAALLAACGGGGISLDELDDELRDRVCQQQVECGGFPDLASCRAAWGNDSDLPQLEQSVADGRASYDEGKADECLDAVSSVFSCEPFTTTTDLEGAASACEETFTGNVELGGECYADEECAGDAECDLACGDGECCAGTCVALDPEPPKANIGEDCSEADCVSGAWCQSTDTGQVCAALGGEGDACQGFSGCQDGLACDGFFSEGVCVRPAKQGETCDPEQGFGVLACARSDNWCDPADTTCKKKPAPGESCNVEVDNCIDYAWCNGGTCEEKPGEGGTCNDETGPDCIGGDLECVNGTCELPPAAPVCGPTA